MGVTKFKGPINSIDGFLFNGRENTLAATRVITTVGGGTSVLNASVAGLSTVEFGFAQAVGRNAGASKIICSIRTFDDGGGLNSVTTAASFMVTYYMSTDSTMSYGIHGAATVDCILIGAG